MKKSVSHNPAAGLVHGEVYRLRCSMKLDEFRHGDTSFVDDQVFLKEFIKIQDITLVSPHRCYYLWKMARRCRKIRGAFAQVGVYKGGSAKLIAQALGGKKKFFLFDTFTGLPRHSRIDGMHKGDFGDVSFFAVKKLFRANKNVTIVKGLFPGSARGVADGEQFVFVYLDMDLYEWNKKALEFFYPRMATGGVIMIDDYGEKFLRGIKKSTDEFFADKKHKPKVTTRFQCMIQF